MGRRKLMRVLDLEKAVARLAAIKSIDPALDLGNGIDADNYEAEIVELATKLSGYNTVLSTVDNSYNHCIAQIQVIKDWNERVLTGVATKYGKNSSEYEMAGGVRKTERKKYTKK